MRWCRGLWTVGWESDGGGNKGVRSDVSEGSHVSVVRRTRDNVVTFLLAVSRFPNDASSLCSGFGTARVNL